MSIKKTALKVLAATGATLAAVPAFATNTEAITTAVSAASGDVGLVTAGVISIAALGFGLGMVVSWLRK